MQHKILAIDFDGTIVDDGYPNIGKPKMFAFDTLKKFQAEGYRLTLWTYRSGKTLEEAVLFCKSNGIVFDAVNASFEGEKFNETEQSRKINADIFIDDRNLGGFPGWGEVYQIVTRKLEYTIDNAIDKKSHKEHQKKSNAGLLGKLFK